MARRVRPISLVLRKGTIRSAVAITVTSKASSGVLALACTPVLLNRMTLEEFGIWGLGTTIYAASNMVDAGMVSSSTVALRATSLRSHSRRVIGLALVATVVSNLLLIAVSVVAWDLILEMLQVPSQLRGDTAIFFALIFLANLSQKVASVLGTVLDVRGLYTRSQGTYAISSLVRWLSVLTIIVLGQLSLPALGVGYLVGGLFSLMSVLVWCTPILRGASQGSATQAAVEWRKMLKGGFNIQTANFAEFANNSADRAIIAATLGLRAVAIYEVADRIAFPVKSLMSTPIPFILSALKRRPTSSGASQMSSDLSRAALLAGAAVASFLVPFLGLWFQAFIDDVTRSVMVVSYLLAIAYVAYVAGVPSFELLKLKHLDSQLMRVAIGAGAVNVGLSISLAPKYGVRGVVLASFIAWFMASGFYYRISGCPSPLRKGVLLAIAALVCFGGAATWLSSYPVGVLPGLLASGLWVLTWAMLVLGARGFISRHWGFSHSPSSRHVSN